MGNGKKNSDVKAYCCFCGSTVGQVSERTNQVVNAIYDCPKCMMNYCDQCSCEVIDKEEKIIQKCLRCDSVINRIT